MRGNPEYDLHYIRRALCALPFGGVPYSTANIKKELKMNRAKMEGCSNNLFVRLNRVSGVGF